MPLKTCWLIRLMFSPWPYSSSSETAPWRAAPGQHNCEVGSGPVGQTELGTGGARSLSRRTNKPSQQCGQCPAKQKVSTSTISHGSLLLKPSIIGFEQAVNIVFHLPLLSGVLCHFFPHVLVHLFTRRFVLSIPGERSPWSISFRACWRRWGWSDSHCK